MSVTCEAVATTRYILDHIPRADLVERLSQQVNVPRKIAFLDIGIRPDLVYKLFFCHERPAISHEHRQHFEFLQRHRYCKVPMTQQFPAHIKMKVAELPQI